MKNKTAKTETIKKPADYTIAGKPTNSPNLVIIAQVKHTTLYY